MFGQSFNAWFAAKGTLVAACRGIDGSGVPGWSSVPLAEVERRRQAAERYTPQEGYGIHFFRALDDGANWEYLFTPPHPAGREYTRWHESGESCFCDVPNGDLLVGYCSYDESIYDTLSPGMPESTRCESKRIPHCFKRRPCAYIILREDRQ